MKTLAIETSCDETGIAVYDERDGLLAQNLYSQIQLHARYGGVVPELASRDHIRKVLPLVQATLDDAGLKLADLDGIAYTAGPGLVGALMVGASVARSMAYALDIPAVGVNHMEGHLLAVMLETDKPEFPFLALLVSGGHTLLVNVKAMGNYDILGESLDDAVGEAFDKTAKLLGLPYPGGAELAKLAEQGKPNRFTFPRPMTQKPGLDFSFSGLKTAASTLLAQHDISDKQIRADIAHAFQAAIVETLFIKCRRAIEQTGLDRLIIAGGVGANQALRDTLKNKLSADVYYPRPAYCTDNGAMIAYAGCQRLLAGQKDGLCILTTPRWPINALKKP